MLRGDLIEWKENSCFGWRIWPPTRSRKIKGTGRMDIVPAGHRSIHTRILRKRWIWNAGTIFPEKNNPEVC